MVISSKTMTLTLRYLFVILTVTWYTAHALSIGKAEDEEELLHRVRRQVVQPECSLADIVFVLDSSGSIGLENWDRVLNFTKSIISAFVIGPTNVQIGVDYYGNSAQLAFNLDRFDNLEGILKEVDDIPWLDQHTNTSGGIRMMYKDMFTVAGGARANAPWIGIVITDGESTYDKNLTIPEANNARSRGISVFAIGIGDQTSQDELNGIANPPSEQFVFNAESFEALGAITEAVVSTTCTVAGDCTATGDILVILDSSGSVGPVHFNNMLLFVRNMIREAAIDEGDARLALMTYGDNPDIKWDLDDYNNRFDMGVALNATRYTAGTTNTAAALATARNTIFTEGRGDRLGSSNIIVLFTDGGSNNFANTVSEARSVKLAGIKILVVAVTNWVNKLEINEITSDPDDKNAFFVQDFDQLFSVFQPLKRSVCNDADECANNPCLNGGTCDNDVNQYYCRCPSGVAGENCQWICRMPANVLIVLDSSASIGETPYYGIQAYAKHLAKSLNLEQASNGQSVGLITFSNEAILRIRLNQYKTKSQMVDAISYPFMGSITDSGEAIRRAVDGGFDGGNGGNRKIMVIFTDGQATDRSEAFRQAARAHNADISVLAIGTYVKGKYARQELGSFASDPDSMNFMEVDSGVANHIYTFTERIVKTICDDIDECGSNPCQGGGSCIDKLNGYECRCTNGRSGINCERGCDGAMDVVFMVDASGSIHEDRFGIVLEFVSNITEMMEVRPGRTHIGAVVFSDNAAVQFTLGQYQQKEDILYAIKTLPYVRGRTNTASALRILYNQMFQSGNGDRSNVPNVAYVITDGLSTVENENTIAEAIKARIAGIHLIVGSVENNPNNLELKGIATRPSASNIFNVDRFGEMYTMADSVSMALCNELNECASNPCADGTCIDRLNGYMCQCPGTKTGQRCERTCTDMADVVFLLDASGSMEDYELTQEMARYIIMGMNFQGDRMRLSVITFQAEAKNRFYMNTYTTQLEALTALSFNNDPGVHGTNTAGAIEHMRVDAFAVSNGHRNGVVNFGIIFSDGRSNMNMESLSNELIFVRKLGIRLMTIGVGNDVDHVALEDISAHPPSENSFYATTVGDIPSVADKVLDQLCF